jgi:hypothetical protein
MKQELSYLRIFLETMGPQCLDLLERKRTRSQIGKFIRPVYLVGRTYQEVAQLQRLLSLEQGALSDPEEYKRLWQQWGEKFTQLLGDCFRSDSADIVYLTAVLWKNLWSFWAREQRAVQRTFSRACRHLRAPGGRERNTPADASPAAPDNDKLPADEYLSADTAPTAYDTLVLSLISSWELAVLGDYVWKTVWKQVGRIPRLLSARWTRADGRKKWFAVFSKPHSNQVGQNIVQLEEQTLVFLRFLGQTDRDVAELSEEVRGHLHHPLKHFCMSVGLGERPVAPGPLERMLARSLKVFGNGS